MGHSQLAAVSSAASDQNSETSLSTPWAAHRSARQDKNYLRAGADKLSVTDL